MALNEHCRTAVTTAVSTSVLTAVVVIFVMLFTGLTGSVKDVQAVNREHSERIVAVETRMDSIVDKIDMIYTNQKEIKGDIKQILQALK